MPLLQRIGTITQSAQSGLGRGKAFRVGSKLALKIGERDLPKFPLGPAIGFHCNPSGLSDPLVAAPWGASPDDGIRQRSKPKTVGHERGESFGLSRVKTLDGIARSSQFAPASVWFRLYDRSEQDPDACGYPHRQRAPKRDAYCARCNLCAARACGQRAQKREKEQ